MCTDSLLSNKNAGLRSGNNKKFKKFEQKKKKKKRKVPNGQHSIGFPPVVYRIRFQVTVTYIYKQLSFLPLPITPLLCTLPSLQSLQPPLPTLMSDQPSLQVPTPPVGISRGNSDPSTNKVQNLPGYTTPVFQGKEEQRAKVQVEVASKVLEVPPNQLPRPRS